jgi:hypothetical protein
VNDDIWSFIDSPELIVAEVRVGEILDKINVVIDGKLDKISKVGVQNVVKPSNDSLKWVLGIDILVSFEEVMVLSKLILDFSNEEVSPLNHNILGHCGVVS